MGQSANLLNGGQVETPRMMRTVSATTKDWDFGFY